MSVAVVVDDVAVVVTVLEVSDEVLETEVALDVIVVVTDVTVLVASEGSQVGTTPVRLPIALHVSLVRSPSKPSGHSTLQDSPVWRPLQEWMKSLLGILLMQVPRTQCGSGPSKLTPSLVALQRQVADSPTSS